MARIRNRGGRSTAEVRYKGREVTQTFGTKTAAQTWARRVEAAIDEGRWPLPPELLPPRLRPKSQAVDTDRPSPAWSVRRAFEEYERTVTLIRKKGQTQESNRIAWWGRQPLADRRLDEITARELQEHVEARLAAGLKANTIRNEIFLVSALIEFARTPDVAEDGKHGWGLAIANPVADVRLPPPPSPRKRRLQDGHGEQKSEEERMRAALADGLDAEAMLAVFVLAVETGMRLSEILDVRRGQIRSAQGTRTIERPDSKSGQPRKVVLSTRAAAAVDALLAESDEDGPGERVIYLDGPQVEYRWQKAREVAKVEGLRFHDLRHEGLSRMAARGLTVGELKEQSGHKTTKILVDYVNAIPSEVAKKLG